MYHHSSMHLTHWSLCPRPSSIQSSWQVPVDPSHHASWSQVSPFLQPLSLAQTVHLSQYGLFPRCPTRLDSFCWTILVWTSMPKPNARELENSTMELSSPISTTPGLECKAPFWALFLKNNNKWVLLPASSWTFPFWVSVNSLLNNGDKNMNL